MIRFLNLRLIIKRGKKKSRGIEKRRKSRKEVAEVEVGIGIEIREERIVRVVVISRTGNGIDRGLIRVVVRVKVNITRVNIIIGGIRDLGPNRLINHRRD